MAIPCEMGTKKGEGTPYQSEALLPVIFSTIIVLAIYSRGKVYPISNRAIFALFLSSTPPSVLSVARNSLALPLVD